MLTRFQKNMAWSAACVICVSSFEGFREAVYLDTGGVPTICFGETRGVRPGDTATKAECEQKLLDRINNDFGPGVDKCIKHPLPNSRKVAYTSLAYNIGIPTFCKSAVAKLENNGQYKEACNAIPLYNKVRVMGVLTVSKGLTKRRKEEQAICLTV